MRMAQLLAVQLLAAAALAAGCGDDDDGGTPVDAGGRADSGRIDSGPGPVDAGPTDAGGNDDAGPTDAGVDPVVRGQYLVDVVSGCIDCHTPRTMTGELDMTNYLAGVECFIDVDPTDATVGCLSSRNLTNHATGLMTRTDDEIKDMFLNGTRPTGEALVPVMPYYSFHNMSAEDADAIVAYLRTVTGVDHMIPANQPPFTPPPAPATPIDPMDIPMPVSPADPEAAMRGRYLAAMAGVCLECHTPENPPGSAEVIDMTRPFHGGREFPAAGFGLPVPPFPETIYSANVTPHATGIEGWSVADVVTALKMGQAMDMSGICPPMPAGPMGIYANLTDDDAADIGAYLLALPPADNTVPNDCMTP